MEPILTGVFIVALYKATELVWKKAFDAVWDPVDKGLKERFARWAGTDADSKREAAFLKAAAEARDLTLRQAGDRQQAEAIWGILDSHPDRRAAEALAEEAAKLMLFAAAPDVPRLTEACDRALRHEAALKGERPPEPEEVAEFLSDFLTNLREALLDQRPYEDLVQKEMLRELRKIAGPAVPHADERSYRYQVAELHRRLEFVGIPELKERKPITVEDIFVRLRAERETAEPHIPDDLLSQLNKEERERLLSKDLTREQLERLSQDFGVTRMMPSDYLMKAVGRQVELEDALRETPKMVVLGDPGTGKTTLLKYLTVICAEGRAGAELGLEAAGGGSPLPVFIPLRAFAAECVKRNEDYNLVSFFYTYARERLLLHLAPGFFEQALKDGRCLVCLDGLDEVWAVGQRRMISDAVMALAALYPRNRYIVTSRIVGYGEAPLDRRAYAHHTVLPLEDEDIAEFVKKWYGARERNAKRRKEQIKDLVDTIQREPRIQTLARNPLLLTIIALVHRIEAELPQERVKLYDKCVTALVDTWDEVKGLTVEEKQRPFFKYRRRLLERLAYELHSRDAAAGAAEEGERGAATIKEGDLEVLLTRLIVDFRRLGFEDDPDGAREEARALVRLARGRTGLLVEQGEGRFGFPHLTFQEYLAACDVENRCIHRGVDALWQEMAERLHDAHWREVILLLLGSLNKYDEPPTLLLERILEAGEEDRFEPVLHRHLGLAARALGDRVDVAAGLHRRIVDQLLEIAASAPSWECTDVLTALAWLTGDDYAADGLLALARDEEANDWVRSIAAEALSHMGYGEEAAELLLALAHDQEVDARVRLDAAVALGQLGRADEAAEILLALARDEHVDAIVRRDAAEALRQLGRADEAAEILLSLARDERLVVWVRGGAAAALGQLEREEEAVLRELLALARDEEVDGRVRSDAAEALGQLGRADEAAEILLSLASDQGVDDASRFAAAAALGQLGRGEESAELLLALADDEEVDCRWRRAAVVALCQLELVEDTVLNGLLALARDEEVDAGVRCNAATALGQLGRADETAEILLALARDAQVGASVRRDAAEALGQLARVEEAAEVLLTLASDAQVNEWTRRDAATALGQLGRGEEAAELLLALASDEEVDHRVRRDASAALGRLGREEEAAELLLALTRDAEVDYFWRLRSYWSLKRLMGSV